jgi:predicted HD phosphohydrolase
VDVGDLGLLLNNYGQTKASINGSGMQLDSQAINLLAAHGITVVPEPTMLGLFGLGVGALLARRRRA